MNQLIFESTFPASWYISSLMWSVVIIFFASRLFSNKVLLWCSLGINIFCTLATNYGLTPLGGMIANGLGSLPVVINPSESFLIALLWIVLGKMFAEREITFPKKVSTRVVLLSSTLIGLYLEQYLNLKFHTTLVSDSFFMLIPLCIVLFSLVLDINISFKERAFFLRAFSTITYCMHISLILVLRGFLKIANVDYQNYPMAILLWISAVVTCSLATLVIVKLENRSSLKWLRFAH